MKALSPMMVVYALGFIYLSFLVAFIPAQWREAAAIIALASFYLGAVVSYLTFVGLNLNVKITRK